MPKKMSISEKIKKCFTSPDELFSAVKNEKMSDAFAYHALMLVIFLFANIAVFLATNYFLVLEVFSYFGPIVQFGIVGIFMVLFFLLMIFNFVSAFIDHVFVKLLGGKSGYSATFKAISYGFTPAAILGWIPFVGLLISIHYFYLNIKGISILHKISMRRAFWALFLPVLIVIIIAAVFLTAFLVHFLASVESSAFIVR